MTRDGGREIENMRQLKGEGDEGGGTVYGRQRRGDDLGTCLKTLALRPIIAHVLSLPSPSLGVTTSAFLHCLKALVFQKSNDNHGVPQSYAAPPIAKPWRRSTLLLSLDVPPPPNRQALAFPHWKFLTSSL